MSGLKVFSLKNCDTCRKALAWLTDQGVPHKVVDVRCEGLSAADLSTIVGKLGWEQVINRRSTTWRNLQDADKAELDNAKAKSLIAANPTLMKRPVFVHREVVIVGFNEDARQKLQALT